MMGDVPLDWDAVLLVAAEPGRAVGGVLLSPAGFVNSFGRLGQVSKLPWRSAYLAVAGLSDL